MNTEYGGWPISSSDGMSALFATWMNLLNGHHAENAKLEAFGRTCGIVEGDAVEVGHLSMSYISIN